MWQTVGLLLLVSFIGKSAVISGADNEVESAASVANETCSGTDVACMRTKLPADDDLTTKFAAVSAPLATRSRCTSPAAAAVIADAALHQSLPLNWSAIFALTVEDIIRPTDDHQQCTEDMCP